MKSIDLFSSLFLFAMSSIAADRNSPSNQISPLPTKRISDCISRITGLDNLSPIEKKQRISFSEVNIPFLSPKIKGQGGIRVDFSPARTKWSTTEFSVADPYVRNISVYLDAEANRIVAVTAHLPERSPDIHPEPSPDSAEIRTSAQTAKFIVASPPTTRKSR